MASKGSGYRFGGKGQISQGFASFFENLQFPADRGVEEKRPEFPSDLKHGFPDIQQKEQKSPGELIYDERLDNRISKLETKLIGLHKEVEALKRQPSVLTSKITNIPSEKYELKEPIEAIIKIDEDEVIAMIPDLELYGEGSNEIEALNDLKFELIDLLEDLDSYPDENLGSVPKAWNKTLKAMINRCQ